MRSPLFSLPLLRPLLRLPLLTSVLCLAGIGARAEPLPTLQDTLGQVIGRDVVVTGYIGRGLNLGDDEAVSFALPDRTTFPVVFDAGRDARRKLEGCQFKMFGGTPCPATVAAEIEMDGSRIRLIVFELREIGPPEKF